MKNIDIRAYANNHGVKLYEIADFLGMQDSNFSRKLRKEIVGEEKLKIFSVIDKIYKEKSTCPNLDGLTSAVYRKTT